jgi:hypothetical protein
MRYFVFGNIWLLLSVLIFMGRHVERTQPLMVSFFGIGRWFTPAGYNIIPLLCLIIAAAFFFLCWKTPAKN